MATKICYVCFDNIKQIKEYKFYNHCGLTKCYENNVIHFHYLCETCKEFLDDRNENRNCFVCHITESKKRINFHHFTGRCGSGDCKENRSHEHYLCYNCNSSRRSRTKNNTKKIIKPINKR